MDNITRQIANFAAAITFDQLPEEVITAATRFLIDTLACAVAAHDCEPARIGLQLARGAVPERYPGRILLHGERSTAELASFVNTAMIRNLDFNDQYPGGHPSDCLGALLAIAETAGADGQRLLSSIILAYELFVRISDATGLRYKGWDQGFAIGICTAAAVGYLLHLTPEKIGEAVAITTVANIPMRNTRAGELSLWKGAATSYATRNGVFAAILAAEGMTGPDRPFEGKHGLWDLITGPFELEPLPTNKGPFRSLDVQFKYWPVEYNAQLPIWAALDLRSKVDWRDLVDIEIGTYTFAFTEIGSEPEKWDPKTRETADHSLPYIFARALVDGIISLATFEEPAYRDPALRPLMARIRVHCDDEVNALYPKSVSIKVKARSKDGRTITIFPRDPLGHTNNPMKDQDISTKFRQCAESKLGKERTSTALQHWWNTKAASVSALSQAVKILEVG